MQGVEYLPNAVRTQAGGPSQSQSAAWAWPYSLEARPRVLGPLDALGARQVHERQSRRLPLQPPPPPTKRNEQCDGQQRLPKYGHALVCAPACLSAHMYACMHASAPNPAYARRIYTCVHGCPLLTVCLLASCAVKTACERLDASLMPVAACLRARSACWYVFSASSAELTWHCRHDGRVGPGACRRQCPRERPPNRAPSSWETQNHAAGPARSARGPDQGSGPAAKPDNKICAKAYSAKCHSRSGAGPPPVGMCRGQHSALSEPASIPETLRPTLSSPGTQHAWPSACICRAWTDAPLAWPAARSRSYTLPSYTCGVQERVRACAGPCSCATRAAARRVRAGRCVHGGTCMHAHASPSTGPPPTHAAHLHRCDASAMLLQMGGVPRGNEAPMAHLVKTDLQLQRWIRFLCGQRTAHSTGLGRSNIVSHGVMPSCMSAGPHGCDPPCAWRPAMQAAPRMADLEHSLDDALHHAWVLEVSLKEGRWDHTCMGSVTHAGAVQTMMFPRTRLQCSAARIYTYIPAWCSSCRSRSRRAP